MSWQLHILNAALRLGAKPHLRRTKDPKQGAQDFDRASRMFHAPPYTCHLVSEVDGLRMHRISVGNCTDRRAILYIHGGAYFTGSGQTHMAMLARLSKLTRTEVIAPDYRLLQDAPFPAAFDDAVTAWNMLVQIGYDPCDIVLGGDSAGGGLALALLAHLTQIGTPPAGLFAMSPWTDLTLSGGSVAKNAKRDPLLPAENMPEVVDQYLAGAAPDDPRASPLFAKFISPPPVMLQVGSPEVLEDDTYRMAEHLRAAGGDVAVQTWDRAPHVFHIFDGWLPEARAALTVIADFVQTSFAMARR